MALKPSHWFEKGKTHQRQAQRRAWQTTASTNEHNFCGGAIVLVGEKIIDLRTNPRKRASNNNTTIKSSKISSTSHRAGRTSRATEPKVVRGKSGAGRTSRATEPKVVRGKKEGRCGEESVGKCRGCWTTKGAE